LQQEALLSVSEHVSDEKVGFLHSQFLRLISFAA
jgi:hypothetical protein